MEAIDSTQALSTHLFAVWYRCLSETCRVAKRASLAGRAISMPNLQRHFLRQWSHACEIDQIYCDKQIRAGQLSGKKWIRRSFNGECGGH